MFLLGLYDQPSISYSTVSLSRLYVLSNRKHIALSTIQHHKKSLSLASPNFIHAYFMTGGPSQSYWSLNKFLSLLCLSHLSTSRNAFKCKLTNEWLQPCTPLTLSNMGKSILLLYCWTMFN